MRKTFERKVVKALLHDSSHIIIEKGFCSETYRFKLCGDFSCSLSVTEMPSYIRYTLIICGVKIAEEFNNRNAKLMAYVLKRRVREAESRKVRNIVNRFWF